VDFSQIILLLGGAFLAQVMGSMAGFGAATILTPVAVLFMDIKPAIALVAIYHLFANISRIHVFRGNIKWAIVWRFGITAVGMSLVGALLSDRLPSDTLRLLFGIFLVVFTLIFSVFPKTSLTSQTPTLVGGGMVSGFIAGLIGAGGAIRSACLLSFGMVKEHYIATSAFIALAVDLTRVPVYLTKGSIQQNEHFLLLIGLIPMAYFGAKLGKRIVEKVSAQWFRRFVLGMLFLVVGGR